MSREREGNVVHVRHYVEARASDGIVVSRNWRAGRRGRVTTGTGLMNRVLLALSSAGVLAFRNNRPHNFSECAPG
jgi:hypothetical protein